MKPAWPRYLLFTESITRGPDSPGWRFVLHGVDSDHMVTASDHEPGMRGERLELMAVVRGLEALSQPSSVKLVTGNRHVRRGVSRGLSEWRANDWHWERFGGLTPIRNSDLWRRIDSALQFHRVSCRGWRTGVSVGTTASESRLGGRLPDERAGRAYESVLNEPALLIVRGRRRHVFPSPTLAAAG